MRVGIKGHVRTAVNGDGGVLLDLEQGKYFSLNGIGAEIWKKLQEEVSLPELEQHLRTTYSAPPERIRQDLQTFIQRLQALGVIDVSAA